MLAIVSKFFLKLWIDCLVMPEDMDCSHFPGDSSQCALDFLIASGSEGFLILVRSLHKNPITTPPAFRPHHLMDNHKQQKSNEISPKLQLASFPDGLVPRHSSEAHSKSLSRILKGDVIENLFFRNWYHHCQDTIAKGNTDPDIDCINKIKYLQQKLTAFASFWQH